MKSWARQYDGYKISTDDKENMILNMDGLN